MKEKSLGKILTKCSYVLFAIAFGYISLNIMFADKIHSYKITQLLPGMMVGGVVVAIGMFILSKIAQDKVDRHFKKVLIVFSIVYYIVLIRMGFLLRFTRHLIWMQSIAEQFNGLMRGISRIFMSILVIFQIILAQWDFYILYLKLHHYLA